MARYIACDPNTTISPEELWSEPRFSLQGGSNNGQPGTIVWTVRDWDIEELPDTAANTIVCWNAEACRVHRESVKNLEEQRQLRIMAFEVEHEVDAEGAAIKDRAFLESFMDEENE